MYATAALQIKASLPEGFQFFARYFLSRARHICKKSGDQVPADIQWLCHPEGHRFVVDNLQFDFAEQSLFSSRSTEVDPLAVVTQAFREHLVEQALFSLVNPSDPSRVGKWRSSEPLAYTQLVAECSCLSTAQGAAAGLATVAAVDEVALWWSNIVSVAYYWMVGDEDNASRSYSVLDVFPSKLHNVDDPLARAVYLAYKARKNVSTTQGETDVRMAIKQCDRAGRLLRESLKLTYSDKNRVNVKNIQLLLCDWLLSTRATVWEMSRPEGTGSGGTSVPVPASQTELIAFQQDLASLQKLSQQNKAALPKLFLHEATARIMAGASPARTQQLLDRNIRQRHQSKTTTEKDLPEVAPSECFDREKAKALLMAGRHLPQSMTGGATERIDLIKEASRMYESLGDKKSVQLCRKTLLEMDESKQVIETSTC